jgi:2,5-dihydroxypyridine 5,6-dioxygenase
MKNLEMIKGIRTLLDKCARVQAGEKVLIVADMHNFRIAEILATAAIERDTEVVVCFMTPRKAHGENPPETIISAMMKADVVFEPTTYSLTRSEATQKAAQAGARVVSMPAYVEEMLISGAIEADFPAHEETVEALANLFTQATTARLTAPGGTNITMDLGGPARRGDTGKGFCPGPGTICGPPNIEANISPIEETAEGRVVADVSVPDPQMGVLSAPIELTVKDGFVTEIKGGTDAANLRKILEEQKDHTVYNIAELGIGLNPKARICGIMLEDEGALGTAHIGIGDNHTSGGIVHAPLHLDMIISNPTLELDGKIVIKDSELLF